MTVFMTAIKGTLSPVDMLRSVHPPRTAELGKKWEGWQLKIFLFILKSKKGLKS